VLLSSCVAIAAIPIRNARDHPIRMRGPDVIPVLTAYRTPTLPISAVFPIDRRHSTKVPAFVDFLRKELEKGADVIVD